ncbi:MAG: hypothetical protein IRZ31_19785 [Thermogemmatispora sp.]|uniref:hypothetical protein n=1 Tax=Thermogemmatispora sp. TaxID=1968838 RepID=UPI0026247BB0|nr:hypothetical protein [Thermogemmatispora sp.]MBX5459139.1 hypothetical protein [Thermogemmatispora sp.]
MDKREYEYQHEQEPACDEERSPMEQLHLPLEADEQTLPEAEALDPLREAGLLPEEIQRLLQLRRRVQKSGEIPPYLSGDPHLQFARWLYEHGAIGEFSESQEEAS